jgi:hypothetical protein
MLRRASAEAPGRMASLITLNGACPPRSRRPVQPDLGQVLKRRTVSFVAVKSFRLGTGAAYPAKRGIPDHAAFTLLLPFSRLFLLD